MKILLTGSSGFIGSALAKALESHDVVAPVRGQTCKDDIQSFRISGDTDWKELLAGCSVVVHCASITSSENPVSELFDVNVGGTKTLAEQAAVSGVSTFVFLSSIKVNGESTDSDIPFTHMSECRPVDPYGKSKLDAENAVKNACENSSMDYVIIRAPLVYGPGVKANFLNLIKALSKRLPLPLRCIRHNKRSLVGLSNLVDLIVNCINNSAAKNQIFMVSDGRDLSTSDLIQLICRALGVRNFNIPVPISIIRLVGVLFGKQEVTERLLGNLHVDIDHTKETLGWTPSVEIEQELSNIVKNLKVLDS